MVFKKLWRCDVATAVKDLGQWVGLVFSGLGRRQNKAGGGSSYIFLKFNFLRGKKLRRDRGERRLIFLKPNLVILFTFI